jgi:hypothetical protein
MRPAPGRARTLATSPAEASASGGALKFSAEELANTAAANKAQQDISLALYDRACAALAEARSVDEILQIHDQARALAACARVAKNRSMEADAVEIRMRAARRLDQLRQSQRETVGLNQGAAGGGRKNGSRGLLVSPRDLRPTLASQGIDKNLAHQARVLGAMDDAAFERKVAEARDSAARVYRRAVREAEIEHEREERRARTAAGGSVADLYALIASGYRAGLIAIDPPWPFAGWSERSHCRPTDHYETMTIEETRRCRSGSSRPTTARCAVG